MLTGVFLFNDYEVLEKEKPVTMISATGVKLVGNGTIFYPVIKYLIITSIYKSSFIVPFWVFLSYGFFHP